VWARGSAPSYVGPLDGLAAPALAYSTRRLFAAWEGNCLQLRRGSDDATLDFGFTALGVLDIDDITTWLGGATGYVAGWYDQTGGGRHLTQATASNQPGLLTASSALNDLPCLNFDGVNDQLFHDAGVSNTIFSSTTCFAAGLYSAPANMNVVARLMSFTVGGNDYDNSFSFTLNAPGGTTIRIDRSAPAYGVSGPVVRPTDAAFVATARNDATNYYAGVNTTEGTAGTGSTTLAPRRASIGDQAIVAGAPMLGKCAEWVVFSSVPTDRADIIAAVKTYGGIA
jgi:hypothetical protein